MVRLRVPINDGNANAGGAVLGIPTSGVQVFIPAALNRPSHTLYSICTAVQPTLQEWTVNRRYSQFLSLRQDILATLSARKPGDATNSPSCPTCLSFALALRKFDFPRKAWIRTNRIVRKRVKSLQLFLQLLVERLYNDLPKCHVCGDQVKKMVRPFLIRGAQPLGDSNIIKIQHSLSLQSYAIVKHKPRHQRWNANPEQSDDYHHELVSKNKAPSSSSSADSMATTDRTDSDPAMSRTTNPHSPSQVDFQSSTISEDSYGKQFDGEERCTEARVPLEEALKQVVVLDKRNSTIEEIAFRLSSMWDAYDLQETLATAPELKALRLSNTREEDSEDDMMMASGGGNGSSGPYYDDDDDEIGMLEAESDDENNVSLALLQDECVFDEDDDDDRMNVVAYKTNSPLPVDQVTF